MTMMQNGIEMPAEAKAWWTISWVGVTLPRYWLHAPLTRSTYCRVDAIHADPGDSNRHRVSPALASDAVARVISGLRGGRGRGRG